MKNVEKTMARTVQKQINCFYQCAFTTTQRYLMEKHYHQEHYLKPQEVKHG